MTVNLESLYKRIKDSQYKLTVQRQVILDVFLQHQEMHLSAEDVYHLVKQAHPEVGLATVYRTLEMLSELNILQKMDFGDGRSRYELNEVGHEHQHHHLICLRCGKVREFADDLLDSLEQSIAAQCDFQIVDHQVKFYGHCRECRAEGV